MRVPDDLFLDESEVSQRKRGGGTGGCCRASGVGPSLAGGHCRLWCAFGRGLGRHKRCSHSWDSTLAPATRGCWHLPHVSFPERALCGECRTRTHTHTCLAVFAPCGQDGKLALQAVSEGLHATPISLLLCMSIQRTLRVYVCLCVTFCRQTRACCPSSRGLLLLQPLASTTYECSTAAAADQQLPYMGCHTCCNSS